MKHSHHSRISSTWERAKTFSAKWSGKKRSSNSKENLNKLIKISLLFAMLGKNLTKNFVLLANDSFQVAWGWREKVYWKINLSRIVGKFSLKIAARWRQKKGNFIEINNGSRLKDLWMFFSIFFYLNGR